MKQELQELLESPEKKVFMFCNGYANSADVEYTLREAIKAAEDSSEGFDAPNWVYMEGHGEIGRTYKIAPLTWKFRFNK